MDSNKEYYFIEYYYDRNETDEHYHIGTEYYDPDTLELVQESDYLGVDIQLKEFDEHEVKQDLSGKSR